MKTLLKFLFIFSMMLFSASTLVASERTKLSPPECTVSVYKSNFIQFVAVPKVSFSAVIQNDISNTQLHFYSQINDYEFKITSLSPIIEHRITTLLPKPHVIYLDNKLAINHYTQGSKHQNYRSSIRHV